MIDNSIQEIWNSSHTDIMWIKYNVIYSYYYAEKEVYLVRNDISGIMAISTGSSPKIAIERSFNF